MKKIKHLMIWIGLLLSLVSCKDTMEAIGLGGDEIPAEGLVLNLQLTNFTKQQIGTRAGASETFNSLWAVFYGDNNEYLDKADCFSTLSPPQPDGSYKVKITNVPAGTKNVHLVANASDMTKNEEQDLQSLTAAMERDPQLDAPICWGKISIDSLLKANPSVTMLRQCAKISLEIDKGIQSYFTNAGLYVYNMATKAAIAPANYIEPKTDSLAESTVLRTDPLGGGTATTVAVNETSAGKAMVIIKANYTDSVGHAREGYYKVALYKDANKTTQYALLRNHHYTIKVIKVNDYGFSTIDEAKKSQPENRLEVEVRDDNPEITKMIACKDYELGVSDYQEINANTTEATVTIVTTLPKATSSDGRLYSVKRNDTWITACQQETVNDIPETSSSSKGKKYTLKLTLEKNNQSENPRKGTITVTSGDLSLDITIKQAGFDFRRKDPNRIVTMQYNNSTVADNYFKWLDTGVQGITPEEMQGAVRNDGLHFCVGTADITYLIPKLNGDQITKKDDKIKVEEDKGKWKVSLANTTVNEDLWKSSFTITNQAGIEITYPVYHTGIFHKIDENSKVYKDYQLAENGDNEKKVKGWFYYGVVKVQGKKTDKTTTTYYMLDRNLGASNNGYYAPDVVALEKNKKAIGGYFCISEKKNTSDATQGNLSSTLAPKGYTIPTDAVFEELVNAGNLEVVPQSTSLGETYNCVRIKTVDSELPYIYLPMGGFLDGESHKNPIHVNLWTKTLLSGTQGFGTNSPEYGFWYRYFDVYNKRIGLSNMRFVSGSNGMNNGRYKAMPIRLILNIR